MTTRVNGACRSPRAAGLLPLENTNWDPTLAFHIPVLWEHPLRENTVPIAPCATNAVVNRWAGTNIM